ncbi:RNA polymerase sigma factor [Planctomycetes bacterium Poly30]|uniref:RNA polymerase sigma factor n=2 Tax=Saltatorellus ferox TaxID=2528018 RepID=A0A518EQM3_9BACT|nr:RNA polymerase sigma factor [Planctomycetes bacterium Poly30]
MHAHGPFLRRLARALVRDEHLAEELVQDTWLAAHAAAEPIREQRAWLGTVLRRRAASVQRSASSALALKGAGSLPNAVPGEEKTSASSSDVLALLERERLLAAAVERLEEPYRTAVFLRYHEDLLPRRIAKETGAPVKTVMTRIRRGLEKLKVDLDRELGADDEGRSLWFSAIAPLGLEWGGSAPAAGPATSSGSAVWPIKATGLAVLGAAAAIALVVALQAPEIRSMPVLEAPTRPTAVLPGEMALGAIGAPASSPAAEPLSVAVTTGSARQAETSTLRVRVVDAEGEPASGENVLFTSGGYGGEVSSVWLAVSEAGGVATFTVPPGIRGVARHAASAGDLVVESTPGSGEAAEVTLPMAKMAPVVGRVLGADGEPVAGARVYLVSTGTTPANPTFAAISGPDGAYSLRSGSENSLMAVHGALAPSDLQRLRLVPWDNDRWSGVDLVLGEAGSALTGRVVDENGDPIAGAAVHAGPRGGVIGGSHPGGTPYPVLAMTDEEGRFAYPAAISPGEHPVTVTRAGLAPSVRKVDFSGAPVELEITMVGGTLVQGQVLAADGTPAVQAWVDYVEPGARTLDRLTTYSHGSSTDENGHFALHHVPSGTHELRAVSQRDEELARASAVIAPEDETLEQNLQLSLEPMIAGRVVDMGGQPITGLYIGAEPPFGNAYRREVRTDAEGRFRLTALPPLEQAPLPDRFWTVSVSSPGKKPRPVLATRELVAPGTLDLEFEVPFAGESAAVLVGSVDSSLMGALVLLMPAGWAPGVGPSGAPVLYSSDDGRFEHGPVAPGTYYLEARRNQEIIASRTGIEVGIAGLVDVGTLAETPGATLEFELAFEMPDGFPEAVREPLLSQQHIVIERGGRTVVLDRTESGWRSQGHLEAGEWSVRILRGERLLLPPTTVTLVEGETTSLVGQGAVGAHVPVRVLMPDAEAWSRASVRAYSTSGTLLSTTNEWSPADLKENGALSFHALAIPGECDLALVIDGVEAATRQRATVLPIFEPSVEVEIDAR